MTGHIYLIRNLLNSKGYVGKTELSVDHRYAQHLRNASGFVNTALYRAIRKHGEGKFSVSEVASCDSSLLNDLEKHYIKFYGTYAPTGHGYNMTKGGEGQLGLVHSEETKMKMSASHMGHIVTTETKLKTSLANKGKKPSKACMDAVILANTGKVHSAETKAKLSAIRKGKKRGPMSEGSKEKLSTAKKGQVPWNKGMTHKEKR
jgi:group I intron endonuclease